MRARLKWLLFAVLALDLVFVAWSCAVNQLHVIVVSVGPAELRLLDGSHATPLRTVAAPDELEVRVRQAGEAAIAVQPFVTGAGALLFEPAAYQRSGAFAAEGTLRSGGLWRSAGAGSELRWQGRAAGLSIALPCERSLGSACVSSDTLGGERCHDLSACTQTLQLAVPSRRFIHHGLAPLWRSALELEAAAPATVERLSVWFGTRLLYERSGFTLSQPTAVGPFQVSRAAALAGFLGDGARLFAQILLLLAVMVFAGAALVTRVVERVGLIEAILLALFVGQALSANATTALYYLMPASAGWPLVLAALCGLTALQLARGGWRCWRRVGQNTSAAEWRAAGLLALAASLSCLVAAFPAVAFPGWFVGQGYTDSVDYPGWASLAHEAAIDRTVGAIRFEDFVRLALTAQTLGIDTRAALAPQILVLWWVFPFLAWALLRRLGLELGPAIAGAVLAAHGYCLFEIATQCYLPHYEVTHFALAGIWATAWFVDDQRAQPDGHGRWWREAVLAAIFAAGVGLYPYQAFSAMAFGLVWLVVATLRRSPAVLLSALRVGLLTLLVCNVNLEVVFDFGQASMQHRASLNKIGREVVFPWHESEAAAGILAGTDDFVRNSERSAEFAAELFAAMPKAGARFQALEGALRAMVPAITDIVLALAAGALFWLLRRRDRAAAVAFMTMLFPLAMALALMASGDVYFWVKSLMTLAALMVVPFAGLVVWLIGSRLQPLAIGALATALAFVALSLRTAWFDSAGYFLTRESATLAKARTHLPVTGEPLWRFEAWVDALPRGQRVVLLGNLQNLYWTNGDVIVYNRLLQLLEGHHVAYADGQTKRYTRSRDVAYRGSEPLSSFDWAISFDTCRPVAGSTLALATDLFCIFRLGPP